MPAYVARPKKAGTFPSSSSSTKFRRARILQGRLRRLANAGYYAVALSLLSAKVTRLSRRHSTAAYQIVDKVNRTR